MEVAVIKSKLSVPQPGFLSACVLGAALFLPQHTAGRQQSSAPAREQKKPEPEQREKAKPVPPREAKTPVNRPEEQAPEKSPPEQTQRPAPIQPREGKDSRPPAQEKQEGEKEAQPPATGAPTPAQAEKAKGTPTAAPTAAQPSPTAQPSLATEETPAQVRPTEKPIQELTSQPAQGQAGAPSPVTTTPPAAGDDRAQWSFRREMEALAQTLSFGKIILSLLFLLLGYFANKLVALLAARAGGRRNVYAEWLRRVAPFVSFSLWFAVALAIVQIFTQPLFALALLITAALASAFASQPLLRDLAGGLVILFEHPFRLGDHITVGDHQGEVKEIGLRAFQLASSNGALIAVPNAAILRQPIINASRGMVEGRVTINLPLPDGIDLEHARRVAFEAAILSPYACIHKPVEVYTDEQRQNDMRARIIIQAYVFDARYERQLRSDTVERARRGFQSLRRVTSDAQRLPD